MSQPSLRGPISPRFLPALIIVVALAVGPLQASPSLLSARASRAAEASAHATIQALLDARPRRPVRGTTQLARRVVDNLRVVDGWALASILPERPSNLDGPELDAFLGDVQLALAWSTAGAWQASLEGDAGWRQALEQAPVTLLAPASKAMLTPARAGETRAANTQAPLMLPWPVGETWNFTQGPHDAANSALDFGPRTAGRNTWVVAPADGVVINTCGTSLVVMRLANGKTFGFYHLSGRPPGIYVGASITRGTRLGHPSTNVDCGGRSVGEHVHFYRADLVPIAGEVLSGYTVIDDGFLNRAVKRGRLVRGGDTVYICGGGPGRCTVTNDARGPSLPAPPPTLPPAPPTPTRSAPTATPPAPTPPPPTAVVVTIPVTSTSVTIPVTATAVTGPVTPTAVTAPVTPTAVTVPVSPTATVVLPPPQSAIPPATGEIVVQDQNDSHVERGGTPSTFYAAGAGAIIAQGQALWTYRNRTGRDNYLKWKPPLDRCGVWEVFAYIPRIPNGLRDTTNATYEIRHRSGSTPAGKEAVVAVNVDAVNAGFGATRTDRWYSLGIYLWSAAADQAGEYVLLSDTTGEPGLRSVAFDDLRWVFRGQDEGACNPLPAPSPLPNVP